MKTNYCLVFNSTTKGKQTRVDSCFTNKERADAEGRQKNRTVGYGGFYSLHKAKTIMLWRKLRYPMNFDALDASPLSGARRRRTRR